MHSEYTEATIDPAAFTRFSTHLHKFLNTRVTFEVFTNFLRSFGEYRKYFQVEYMCEGHTYFLTVERLYEYEHSSKNRVGDATRQKLLAEVDLDEFALQPYPNRQVLNVLEKTLNGLNLGCCSQDTHEKFKQLLPHVPDVDGLCHKLKQFVCTHPQLPGTEKHYRSETPLSLPVGMTRAEIVATVQARRGTDPVADLAFYAGRRFGSEGWPAFLKALFERNPVSLAYFSGKSPEDVYRELLAWPNQSIYDDLGVALPDEVVNYFRGDGLEKALTLAQVLRVDGGVQESFRLQTMEREAVLWVKQTRYAFPTDKPILSESLVV